MNITFSNIKFHSAIKILKNVIKNVNPNAHDVTNSLNIAFTKVKQSTVDVMTYRISSYAN